MTKSTEFSKALGGSADATNAMIDRLIPPLIGTAGDARLVEAMRYAVLNGGKRLRAFLAIETAALFGVSGEGSLRVAASVECLHAYSLVHDDMPCMDNDDLRRGKPTVHKAYDEATAVLVGDALQTLAFQWLAEEETHSDPKVRCALVCALAAASGHLGMVGGQAVDIAAEASPSTFAPEEVARLQSLKTGALILYSAEAGALLGDASADELARICAYARDLGLAFQIADDLLDVEGEEALAGKRLRKDAAAGKATFVDLLGVEGARQKAARLVEDMTAHLEPFGARANLLIAAGQFVVERKF